MEGNDGVIGSHFNADENSPDVACCTVVATVDVVVAVVAVVVAAAATRLWSDVSASRVR